MTTDTKKNLKRAEAQLSKSNRSVMQAYICGLVKSKDEILLTQYI